MTSADLETYAGTVMNTFGLPGLVIDRGEGVYLWDTKGRRYLDLLGGIAVNCLGHAHPALVAAVSEQMARLSHVSNFFATAPQISAASALLENVCVGGAPEGSRVFFANSGTEANEAAVKIVRAHAGPTRPRILALTHAFHGRSTGALALTWKEAYRAPFAPLMPGVEFIDPTPQALEAAWGDDVGGVFLEPIQGEAGVWPLEADFAWRARELTRDTGALLVVDEIQTGIGRTGEWMAHHAWSDPKRGPFLPDVVTVAKGLGGGFPVGACVGIGEAGAVLMPGMHGTTFGGNPLAGAAVCATLATLEADGLLAHAKTLGRQIRTELRELGPTLVSQVRGAGLLIGADLVDVAAPAVVAELARRGIIANATGPHTLRFAPALILTLEDWHPVPAQVAAAIEAVREP